RLGEERAVDDLARILVVAAGEEGERARHSLGGAIESLAVRLRIEGTQDGRDVRFEVGVSHRSASNGWGRWGQGSGPQPPIRPSRRRFSKMARVAGDWFRV